jgi:plasmid stabilization system protein ParE
MTGYRFYPTADKAQDDIWDYSVRKWGEAQAETYIKGLHEHLQKLADRELRWLDLPVALVIPEDLQIEAWFSKYRHHMIFFKLLSDGDLGIMSILHEAMDMPVRLAEDLQKISDQKE